MKACLSMLSLFASLGLVTGGAHAQVTRNVLRVNAAGARVVLREALRIGSADGEHDSFGRVSDVALDRRGRVYVADDLNHHVAVFGSDGRFIANLGRQGSGPGEFTNPWLVRVDPGDSVFVWDMGAARISVFGPDLRYRRSFATPPSWIINGMEFLPNGELVVAAYGPGEQRPLHRLRRDGTRVGSFGPVLRAPHLAGFEASLLGGPIALDAQTLVYSSKSPYELDLYDTAGRPQSRCVGRAEWTTPPAAVVTERGAERSLQWNRFVHATTVLALGGGLYLNVIHAPRTNRDTLDLLDGGCRLVRRTVMAAPVQIVSRSGRKIAAVRALDYDEVVVYDFSISPR